MKYFLIAIIFFMSALACMAQRKGYSKNDPYANTQFYLGFRIGSMLTKAKATDRFTTFENTDQQLPKYSTYNNFRNPGYTFGMEFLFTYKSVLGISFQPSFSSSRYSYKNDYTWQDDTIPSNKLTINYKQRVNLDYLSLPILIKYDFTKGNIRPFIQAGFAYNLLINANKQVVVETTDEGLGGISQYEREKLIVGAKDLFIKTQLAYILGFGASFKMGNIRLVADIKYLRNFHNISNSKNRFTNNQLSGTGEVNDNIKLRQILISVGCLFPIKYLTDSRFEAID